MHKKLFAFLFAAASLSAISPRASAQNSDIQVNGSTYYVTLASGVAWEQLGGNYIFTPLSPNVGSCLFIENNNTSSSHTITVTAFQNGDPSLSAYKINPSVWATDTVQNAPTTIPANSVVASYVSTTGAAHVAIVISNTVSATGSPDTANIFIVQTEQINCGPAGITQIQGAVAQNQNVTKVDPVYIGGLQNGGSTLQPFQVAANGGMLLARPLTALGGLTGTASTAAGTYDGTSSSINAAAKYLWSQNANNFLPEASVDGFHDASASASGDTAVWTPITGHKFRMMCVGLEVTGNAAAASAGILIIQLRDGTNAIPGFKWQVAVPATGGTSGELLQQNLGCFRDGFLSSTANNVLNVNLSETLTSGTVEIRAYGTDQ